MTDPDGPLHAGAEADGLQGAARRVDAAATTGRPLRLKPKSGGRFFGGAPWIYANELVLDRRTKAVAPGSVMVIEDSARAPLGLVGFNPASTIAARLLDRNLEATIDASWLAKKISAAAAWRRRFDLATFHRLVHAEADGLPGLVVDRYGDAVVAQPNAAWIDRLSAELVSALRDVLSVDTVILNGASRARTLEGLPLETRLAAGAAPDTVACPMNGAVYCADLLGGQKTGLFFDQRPTHAAVAALSGGGSVLDVFAHVGGFSLACLAAGAASALAVDGSAPALALARRGAEASGVADRFDTLRSDAFDAMRALYQDGRRFDVVICDPPAFAPNKGALPQGLRAYAKTARLGARLVAPGGVFCLCSCSHAVSSEDLSVGAARAFHSERRFARLLREGGPGPDHPAHPHLPETKYLKSLIYALD